MRIHTLALMSGAALISGVFAGAAFAEPAPALPLAPPAAASQDAGGAAKTALDGKEKAEQQRKATEAVHSPSGRAGKQEPGASGPQPPANSAVFVNGRLAVPGAPADSETVPAKFSARNDALDKLPTMAFPIALSDAQRQAILASVRASKAPVVNLDAQITEELPVTVELNELPASVHAEVPNVNKLKFVRLPDERVLLVNPPNRVVVGEVKE